MITFIVKGHAGLNHRHMSSVIHVNTDYIMSQILNLSILQRKCVSDFNIFVLRGTKRQPLQYVIPSVNVTLEKPTGDHPGFTKGIKLTQLCHANLYINCLSKDA